MDIKIGNLSAKGEEMSIKFAGLGFTSSPEMKTLGWKGIASSSWWNDC
jgi:hypothetical protein